MDPYDAHKGFFYAHIGWMLIKPRRKPGVADVSDLSKNEVVRWQHRWYVWLILIFGLGVPTAVAGLWGDFKGGFFYAGAARLMFVHHVCDAFINKSQYQSSLTYLIVYVLCQLACALARRDTV